MKRIIKIETEEQTNLREAMQNFIKFKVARSKFLATFLYYLVFLVLQVDQPE